MVRFPIVFVNHGGGPMPLLGQQPKIVQHFQQVRKVLEGETYKLPKPDAIVVISAHWESNPIQITSAAKPAMYYDYYGFPKESYTVQYPAPGSPVLAEKIHQLLNNKKIPNELNKDRGFDHGVFIPLMIMYPEATIPVVCVSLHPNLNADYHIKLGEALQSLRDDEGNSNILILGSGYTFHNMNAFFNKSKKTLAASKEFDEWLQSTILESKTYQERIDKLVSWSTIAPSGRFCHPREEHLLPLFVTAGAAGPSSTPKLLFNIDVSEDDYAVSSYLFD